MKKGIEQAQLELLKDINEAINNGKPLNEVLQTAVDGVRIIFNYIVCDIFLLEDNSLRLVGLGVDHRLKETIEKLVKIEIKDFKFPLFEGSRLNQILESESPITFDKDLSIFEEFTDNENLKKFIPAVIKIVGFKKVIGVPLVSNEKVLGMLGAATKNEVSEEDIGAIKLFSSHLAMVIERKQAEDGLKRSEERFRILSEGSLAGIYIIQEGKFSYVNPAVSMMFGYNSDDIIDNLGPLDLTHPDDHSMVSAQIHNRLESGEESRRFI